MRIKNKVAMIFLVTYIIRQFSMNKTKIDKSIEYLLQHWTKKREKGKELFFKPSTLNSRMDGDCDDFVTLAATRLRQQKKEFKIGFLLRNNAAYHVFIVMENNILIDPWYSTKKTIFKNNLYDDAEKIVFTAHFKKDLVIIK